jgi:hypothetical protein
MITILLIIAAIYFVPGFIAGCLLAINYWKNINWANRGMTVLFFTINFTWMVAFLWYYSLKARLTKIDS